MDLREVWYGGDGGTEAKQARTSEGEFCDRVERARKEGKRRKERAQAAFLRTVGEGSQLRKEGRREKMRVVHT